MLYLYIFIAVSILGLIYMRFEAGFVEIKKIEFTKSKNGLKILHISDIHIKRLRVSIVKIKNAIAAENPDLVLITGDYIESKKHIPQFLNFLRAIEGSNIKYMCLGNHDYKVFRKDPSGLKKFIEDVQEEQVNLLYNDSVCIEKNSKTYNLIAIEDHRSGYADINKALASCKKNAFLNIAFSHNPDIVLDIPKGKVDYLFCGHFHGGQIWAPFDLEFKLLRKEKLCKMGIKRGLHKINGITLYLNRGLGNVCFPFRFLSRPEITVYYLP